jgi:3-dehydrotetronate 4-kinase
MAAMKLGCITDDHDVANVLADRLVSSGMRVMQTLGVPRRALDAEVDAVVVPIQSRIASAGDAVYRALEAVVWLKSRGAKQIFFCFDPGADANTAANTPGMVAPVIDALMDALGTDFTILVPAFPDVGYTQYNGYLFSGPRLIGDVSPDKRPVTPEPDANLLRAVQARVRRPMSLIGHAHVVQGSVSIQEQMIELRLKRVGLALIDATSNADLQCVGMAARNMPLVAGSPGLGQSLAQNFSFEPGSGATRLPHASGGRAVLCASASEATSRQVEHFHAAGHPAMALDPLRIAKFGAGKVAHAAMTWAAPLLARGPVLLYSSADKSAIDAVQGLIGVAEAGQMVRDCLTETACGLVALGVRQLVIAGTDTGTDCLRSLAIDSMLIGPYIDAGVRWCGSQLAGNSDDRLHFVLKPGAAGATDFFSRAFDAAP